MWSNLDLSVVGQWESLEIAKLNLLSKQREEIIALVNDECVNEAKGLFCNFVSVCKTNKNAHLMLGFLPIGESTKIWCKTQMASLKHQW